MNAAEWHGPVDDWWYTHGVAMSHAAAKARKTGERQRVVRVDPNTNPYYAAWQIVPVTP